VSSSEYIRCSWRHDLPDEPSELFYEVTADRSVTRLVEVFRNGRKISDALDDAQAREPAAHTPSLCDIDYPTIDQLRIDNPGNAFSLIDSSTFEALFRSAEPKGRLA
jgi:hypothetical protein